MKGTPEGVFRRYLERNEERLLFRTVGELSDPLARRDHAWMRLLRHTGVRVGALSRLTVSDAQQALSSGSLQLAASIQKRHQAHSIALNKTARQALKDLLAVRRRLAPPPMEGDGPLVLSRLGRAMSVRSFQVRMRYWCERAGLPSEASPHWLRHTLAKRIVATSTAKDVIGVVQAVLGHRSRSSTAVYTRPDRSDIAQALEEAAA